MTVRERVNSFGIENAGAIAAVQMNGHLLRRRAARLGPLLALVAVVLAIALLAAAGPEVLQRRVTEGLIKLVAVVALYIFVGNSGLLSFGHAGFMAIGAYTSALITMKASAKAMFLPNLPDLVRNVEWMPFPAALLGGLCAAFIAVIAGIPLMRLSGIAASIATFALLSITYIVIGNWTSVTGGQNSLLGLPIYVDLWVALGWAVAAMSAAFIYQETRHGLALRASREDEVAARAAGVHVHRERLIAFVLSAFFSGIAGVLMVHFLGTARIELFYLDLTFMIIALLVVGGTGSLAGAVVGTIVMTGLTEAMHLAEAGVEIDGTTISAPLGLGDVALALIMLLIILFRPKGIMAGQEIAWCSGVAGPERVLETRSVPEKGGPSA